MEISDRSVAVLMLLASTACAPFPEDMHEGTGTTGDDDLGWSEVRCIDAHGPVAVARADGASDSWAYVIHVDELDAREADGEIVRIDSWWDESCAAGQLPDTVLDHSRCYWSVLAGISGCYAGDGEWFAGFVPACDEVLDGLDVDAPAWPPWSCSTTAASADPWDEIRCTDGELGCFAWSGNAAALVRPECWVDEQPELALSDCA